MSIFDYSPYMEDHNDEDSDINWGVTNSSIREMEDTLRERDRRGKEDCSKCKVHPTYEGDLCIHCYCSQRRSIP